MKHWLIVIFCCCAVHTRAQQFVERVYLKDSITFYEGYIIEQAPAKYIKIHRLKESDTVQVALINILKITKEFTGLPQKSGPVVPRKLRYEKAVFLELGGRALLYSLNYDMRTAKGRRDGWGFSIGISRLKATAIGSVSGDSINVRYTMIPFSVNYLFGKKKGGLELGMGATYVNIRVNGSLNNTVEDYRLNFFNEFVRGIFGTFNIGYRHTPMQQGVMYRLMFNPISLTGTAILPWLGFSVGYKFK